MDRLGCYNSKKSVGRLITKVVTMRQVSTKIEFK